MNSETYYLMIETSGVIEKEQGTVLLGYFRATGRPSMFM